MTNSSFFSVYVNFTRKGKKKWVSPNVMWAPCDALRSVSQWSHDSHVPAMWLLQNFCILAMRLSGDFQLIFLYWSKPKISRTHWRKCFYVNISAVFMVVKPVTIRICSLRSAVEEFAGSHSFCYEDVYSQWLNILPIIQQNGESCLQIYPGPYS